MHEHAPTVVDLQFESGEGRRIGQIHRPVHTAGAHAEPVVLSVGIGREHVGNDQLDFRHQFRNIDLEFGRLDRAAGVVLDGQGHRVEAGFAKVVLDRIARSRTGRPEVPRHGIGVVPVEEEVDVGLEGTCEGLDGAKGHDQRVLGQHCDLLQERVGTGLARLGDELGDEGAEPVIGPGGVGLSAFFYPSGPRRGHIEDPGEVIGVVREVGEFNVQSVAGGL